MGDQVKMSLSSLDESAQMMDRTGEEAHSTGESAQQVAGQMQQGVSEVTETLRNHFTNLAESLQQQVQQSHQMLEGTDWVGTSKERALQIESELMQSVERFLSEALQATEEFRDQMTHQAEQYLDGVQGHFNAVMADINQAYGAIGAEERATGQRIAEADQSSFAG